MNGNRENDVNHPPVDNEFSLVVTVIKVVIVAVFLVPIARYIVVTSPGDQTENATTGNSAGFGIEIDTAAEDVVNTTEAVEAEVVERILVKQPACPRSYLLVILEEICTDLMVKREMCTPEDFYNQTKHKIPKYHAKNQSNGEPKVPAIINYAVGGLLITSVGAALVELYKAKKQSPKKNGKNPLSRKCSLADLTVMKHQRKELIRRDSIMEVPEEGHQKQLGFRPPLSRRCSFPVGPNISGFGNYNIIEGRMTSPELGRRLSIVDSRRTSVIDSRRPSFVLDSRRTSIDCRNVGTIDGRRISLSDDSPERRHHSRLVHRH